MSNITRCMYRSLAFLMILISSSRCGKCIFCRKMFMLKIIMFSHLMITAEDWSLSKFHLFHLRATDFYMMSIYFNIYTLRHWRMFKYCKFCSHLVFHEHYLHWLICKNTSMSNNLLVQTNIYTFYLTRGLCY